MRATLPNSQTTRLPQRRRAADHVNRRISAARPLLAEFVGTALLVTVVGGSGIAAAQLSPGDIGLQLLENSIATAFGLAVLILLFGPVSGAHFNPVVSAADWLLGRRADAGITGGAVGAYAAAQVVGRIVGAVLANLMFDQAALEISTKDRFTTGHVVGEVVATAGLIALIFALARTGRAALSALSAYRRGCVPTRSARSSVSRGSRVSSAKPTTHSTGRSSGSRNRNASSAAIRAAPTPANWSPPDASKPSACATPPAEALVWCAASASRTPSTPHASKESPCPTANAPRPSRFEASAPTSAGPERVPCQSCTAHIQRSGHRHRTGRRRTGPHSRHRRRHPQSRRHNRRVARPSGRNADEKRCSTTQAGDRFMTEHAMAQQLPQKLHRNAKEVRRRHQLG
jgi:glycerol uptake facilitator-like aquaporin